MQQVISVIVPVYQVEKYIDRCIQSIQNQTYRNLEIILVDDGSSDKCGEICDNYAKEDSRIKVIHKRNGGLADARNCGINHATGDYLAFVDSDDYIHPRMYERMMEAMESEQAEVVISAWKHVDEDKPETAEELSSCQVRKEMSGIELQNMYFDKTDERIMLTVAWNKLYKRECFAKLRFPIGKLHEDEFVTFKILYEASKIIYIEDILYFYLVRNASIMGNFNVKRFDIFDAYLEKLNYYMLHGEKPLARRTVFLAIHMLVQYYEWIDSENEECRNAVFRHYERWRQKCREVKGKLAFSKKSRIEIFLFCHYFSLYILAWKMKHAVKN